MQLLQVAVADVATSLVPFPDQRGIAGFGDLLALAYHQAPAVSFELRPQVADPKRALERGEADLLIIPKAYCSAEHPAETVLEETFCCVLWNQSPLAAGELTAERYMAAGHIVVEPWEARSALEDWSMQRLGIV